MITDVVQRFWAAMQEGAFIIEACGVRKCGDRS
jgi:hypothetical protein